MTKLPSATARPADARRGWVFLCAATVTSGCIDVLELEDRGAADPTRNSDRWSRLRARLDPNDPIAAAARRLGALDPEGPASAGVADSSRWPSSKPPRAAARGPAADGDHWHRRSTGRGGGPPPAPRSACAAPAIAPSSRGTVGPGGLGSRAPGTCRRTRGCGVEHAAEVPGSMYAGRPPRPALVMGVVRRGRPAGTRAVRRVATSRRGNVVTLGFLRPGVLKDPAERSSAEGEAVSAGPRRIASAVDHSRSGPLTPVARLCGSAAHLGDDLVNGSSTMGAMTPASAARLEFSGARPGGTTMGMGNLPRRSR